MIGPHTISNIPPARAKNGVVNGARKAVKAESEFEDDGEEEEYEEEEYEEDEEEDEEEEEEEDEGEPEDEEDVKPPTDRRAARRRTTANGKPNGRDGLANFGNSLTVTGKSRSSKSMRIPLSHHIQVQATSLQLLMIFLRTTGKSSWR